jgi:hypothetical protein
MNCWKCGTKFRSDINYQTHWPDRNFTRNNFSAFEFGQWKGILCEGSMRYTPSSPNWFKSNVLLVPLMSTKRGLSVIILILPN